MGFRCETFHHIVLKKSTSNHMSFYHKGFVISFGGYKIEEGSKHHYVTCTFDLNESVPMKSGHSKIVTSLSSLSAVPKTSMAAFRYHLDRKQWEEYQKLPEPCADAATCLILNDRFLFVIGGFVVMRATVHLVNNSVTVSGGVGLRK